ncbi:hypothetical protein L1049_013202 [Liquidambar formosana]|uniref:Uncharacterized protein n=1 Tax=Liquidambar formosana TaxID=63359 RepID=A0AAP0RLJ5_LIQFO
MGEIGGMTRFGRYYTPVELELLQKKGKDKSHEANGIKAPVMEEDLNKFLGALKKNEYNLVEQLNKMPAQISILGLLLGSETHRNALAKVLNEAHVLSDITPENFQNMVGQLLRSGSHYLRPRRSTNARQGRNSRELPHDHQNPCEERIRDRKRTREDTIGDCKPNRTSTDHRYLGTRISSD